MNNMKRLLYSTFAFALVLIPSTTFAQVALTNPLETADPRIIVGRVIQGLLGLTGTIALIMIIYGGLMFLTSAGNPGQIDKAKKLLVFTIIGIIVIAASYVATNTLLTAVLTGDPTAVDSQ